MKVQEPRTYFRLVLSTRTKAITGHHPIKGFLKASINASHYQHLRKYLSSYFISSIFLFLIHAQNQTLHDPSKLPSPSLLTFSLNTILGLASTTRKKDLKSNARSLSLLVVETQCFPKRPVKNSNANKQLFVLSQKAGTP